MTRPTQVLPKDLGQISRTGLSPFTVPPFQTDSAIRLSRPAGSPTTPEQVPVWALPLSLAATYGIDFSFSSSGYLDVSVLLVDFMNLWIQFTIIRESPG